jgi:OOP family OmpA-OmpF porin
MGKNEKEISMNKKLRFVFASVVALLLVMTGVQANAGEVIAGVPCPAPAAPVVKATAAAVPAPVVVVAPQKETIYFDFDKSNIKTSEQAKIDKIVGLMKDPKASAIVIGYTDPIGTDQYNMGLSEKRAKSVKAALVKAGVAAEKITLQWKGETNLAKPGLKGIPANAPNRRSEVEVTVK